MIAERCGVRRLHSKRGLGPRAATGLRSRASTCRGRRRDRHISISAQAERLPEHGEEIAVAVRALGIECVTDGAGTVSPTRRARRVLPSSELMGLDALTAKESFRA